ncbi:DUF5954 family protein [Micromonospora sp. NBC_01796]|uniref:DUF5954 family protein n=1 Tax=Micromonospora sp. NBC_01796 TaxID=2975987 RepID=UPI002DDC3FEF|nr:DUF5954 family protein [Micromonospora sp. NBC_01796]WSA84136.1 DUF5954 family protein [Micromonospora sp. NBC_01796]
MTYDGKQVPDHLLINIEQRDDPISAVSEDDARRRSVAYPKLMWGAPIFGRAEEVDGRWRILSLIGDEPQGTRDGLGSHFRRLLSETPDTAENAAERKEYEAAIRLLDWEVVNDLTVNGRRYRIIRAQPFLRMGPDGPEPPRPSDPDPRPAGRTGSSGSQMEGFVIDPVATTGLSDGILRMELVPAFYKKGGIVPDDVREDSRRALATHPNVVLLPVGFTIGEYVDGRWRPRSFSTYPTPQAARESASFNFSDIVPHENASFEEIRAAYNRALEEFEAPRTDEFELKGVRCRVTRVECFVRVGPDGPETPRPSDWDPEPPPELHFQQLRAEGRMPELE